MFDRRLWFSSYLMRRPILGSSETRDRVQQLASITDHRYADFFEIVVSKARQYVRVNLVLGERFRVLAKSQVFQPFGDIMHFRSLNVRYID